MEYAKYLQLIEEDCRSFPNEETSLLFSKLEEVLNEYSSLECFACGSHFGYQHRRDPKISLCSSPCLSIVDQKLKAPGSIRLDDSDSGLQGVLIPETPATPAGATSVQNAEVLLTCERSVRFSTSSTNVAEAHSEINSTTKPDAEDGDLQIPKLVPEPVAAAAAVPPKPKKSPRNKWKFDDVILSPALVDMAECVISCSWGQAKVTVNAVDDSAKMESLEKDIAKFVSNATPIRLSCDHTPRVNDIVFAPYDGGIYRGRVVKVGRSRRVMIVEFIDYGDADLVKVEECYAPRDRIMVKHPMYGLTFTLKTVISFPDDLEHTAKINKIIDDGTFYLQTDGQEPSKSDWVGSLQLKKERKGKKTLNAVLDQFILRNSQPALKSSEPAAVVEVLSTIDEAEEEEPSVTDPPEVKVDPAPVTQAVAMPEINSKESASASSTNLAASAPTPTPAPAPVIRRRTNPFTVGSKMKKTIHDSVVSPNIKDGATVRINFAWNDAMISISCVEDDDELASLDEIIAKYVETAPGLTCMPDIDEIVIACYNGLYYRGRVLSLKDNQVQVRFVDYGADAAGCFSDLKGLNSEIAGRPIYGKVFRMAGVPDTSKLSENHPEISAALESVGKIKLVETDKEIPGELTGIFYLSDSRTWNDVVLEIMEAQEGGVNQCQKNTSNFRTLAAPRPRVRRENWFSASVNCVMTNDCAVRCINQFVKNPQFKIAPNYLYTFLFFWILDLKMSSKIRFNRPSFQSKIVQIVKSSNTCEPVPDSSFTASMRVFEGFKKRQELELEEPQSPLDRKKVKLGNDIVLSFSCLEDEKENDDPIESDSRFRQRREVPGPGPISKNGHLPIPIPTPLIRGQDNNAIDIFTGGSNSAVRRDRLAQSNSGQCPMGPVFLIQCVNGRLGHCGAGAINHRTSSLEIPGPHRATSPSLPVREDEVSSIMPELVAESHSPLEAPASSSAMPFLGQHQYGIRVLTSSEKRVLRNQKHVLIGALNINGKIHLISRSKTTD